jgi:putative hydrolase of the HAD superfamily
MISAVIFDLDDTLYDEIDYCKSGFNAVASLLATIHNCLPQKQIYQAFWEQFQSDNRSNVFNLGLDTLGIPYDENLIQKLVMLYRNHKPNIDLPKESKAVLDALSLKYPLALLTDGYLPGQELKVQALGIEKYFKAIIYTEKLGRNFWKPSTAGFEKILQLLDIKAVNAVYVADNTQKDFMAPNEMSMETIQILRPNRIHFETSAEPNSAAKHVITDLSSLPDLLKTL